VEISIIIPSKDRKAILLQTLEKVIKAIEKVEAEVIVINDSKTENIDINPAWQHKIKVYNNPKSGVASARNLGASKANANLILFMDDDMWVSEENILTTIALHKKYDKSCCINLNWIYPPELNKKMKKKQFGRYLHYYGFDSLKGWCRNLVWNDKDIFPINHITSQYLSFDKADFDRVGGYNENFPHAGFEDYDLGKRLLKSAIQPYIYPLSMLFHNEADRMEVKLWLARKRRGGETRKVAVKMGYKELDIQNGIIKTLLYKILVKCQPILLKILDVIPNIAAFDPLYFKIMNISLGTAFFDGYHNKKV